MLNVSPFILRGLVCLVSSLSPALLGAGTDSKEPDFFDTLVPDAKESDLKKVESLMTDQELKADASLPVKVREVLDKWTKFQLIQTEIIERRITSMRKVVQEKLRKSALDNASDGSLLALALFVQNLPIKEPIQLEKAIADPNAGDAWNGPGGKEWNVFLPGSRLKRFWADGRWHWINRQHTMLLADYWGGTIADVIILASPNAREAVGFNSDGAHFKVQRQEAKSAFAQAPPSSGLRILSEALKVEQAVHSQAEQSTQSQKEQVARWLIEQAKTAPTPAVAKKINEEVAKVLPTKTGERIRRQANLFEGVFTLSDARRLEMLPNGTVLLNGQPAGATWDWCKDANSTTTLIRFGKEDDPTDLWLVRRSGSESGTIRITTRTAYLTAKRK